MNIDNFRQYCSDDRIQITEHALMRCRERNIMLNDIERCIMRGEIIEEYPDDYPYPSALICLSNNIKPIHVLAGLGDNEIWIITAYYPDPQKWTHDYTRRKETEL